MNLPNFITSLRLVLVPAICSLLLIDSNSLIINNYSIKITWLIAGLLFILAALSDWLDGFLARKQNKITTFGKFFDAVADKLLSSTVLIIMSYENIVPIWLTLIVISRDFLIDVVRQILATKNIVLASSWYGKWKFTFNLVGLAILFFINYKSFNDSIKGAINQFGWINQLLLIPLYIATLLSLYSAGVYIYQYRKVLFMQN